MAIGAVLWRRLRRFAHDHPDVVLDINTEGGSPPDLVAGRFDPGIHLGEFVQRDMVAVRVRCAARLQRRAPEVRGIFCLPPRYGH
jgi:DNA-binding transcriptional LysR family regulator